MATEKQCKCGYTVDHHFIEAKKRFGGWGMFLMLMGVNARPTEIRMTCVRCNTVVKTIDDENEIENFTW